jgi:hypothetical protein
MWVRGGRRKHPDYTPLDDELGSTGSKWSSHNRGNISTLLEELSKTTKVSLYIRFAGRYSNGTYLEYRSIELPLDQPTGELTLCTQPSYRDPPEVE